MGALWVVAEPGPDGGLANISAEAATLARELGCEPPAGTSSGSSWPPIRLQRQPTSRRTCRSC